MSVTHIKLASWLVAVLLTGGLAWYVYSFVSQKDELSQMPPEGHVRQVLQQAHVTETREADVIDYGDVTRLYHETGFNWTGKPAPKPVVVDSGPKQDAGPSATPVADLVRILLVQVDTADASRSAVYLRYRPASNVRLQGAFDGQQLHPGDRLESPHEHVRVESIAVDGVTFAFDDEGREAEVLGPLEFDDAPIVEVGPDGVRYPVAAQLPSFSGERVMPDRTWRIGPNRYRVGSEDAQYIADNFAEIMTTEVRHRRHRDPRTGKYDGIELTEVKPGSLAERHGAKSGMVIKKINGHPVTSPSEAITFAKNNQGKYSSWEIEYEYLGKTQILIHETN